MKLLLTILILSTSLFSDTFENVFPELNYNENIKNSIFDLDKSDQNIKTKVGQISFPAKTNHAKNQKLKFVKALALLAPVLNSVEFKKRVLSYKRTCTKAEIKLNPNCKFVDGFSKNYLWRDETKLLSNTDVYNLLKEGNEKTIPNTLGEININSWVKVCTNTENTNRKNKYYRWCNGVIGSTSPFNSKLIKLNWKYYNKYESHQMVANIVHEWIHLLGFLHGPRETMRMEVPYVVGAIAGEIAKEIMQGKLSIK